MENPGFITPPPGLIPDAPEPTRHPEADTGTSGTHRLADRPDIPAFVPAMPGAAPVVPVAAVPTPASVEIPAAEPASAKQWTLMLHDGSTVHLSGPMLLGRDPARLDGWQSADLLTVNDPEKTVSKTHAALAIGSDGTLTVVDLDSTNGVGILKAAAGNAAAELSVLDPGEPEQIHSGDTLRLGNYAVEITSR